MSSKVVAEVSVLPVGTAGTAMSTYVAACVRVLEKYSDIKYRVTPMGTVLEGPLDRILAAVERMHEVPFGMGAMRVVTDIKVDDRRDKVISMESKVEAVSAKMKNQR